jgi:hypothetical protein
MTKINYQILTFLVFGIVVDPYLVVNPHTMKTTLNQHSFVISIPHLFNPFTGLFIFIQFFHHLNYKQLAVVNG